MAKMKPKFKVGDVVVSVPDRAPHLRHLEDSVTITGIDYDSMSEVWYWLDNINVIPEGCLELSVEHLKKKKLDSEVKQWLK